MLFDSDTLIWVMRGHEGAAVALNAVQQRATSVASYMEMVIGARDRNDLNAVRPFLQRQHIAILPLTEAIGDRASIYLEEYVLATRLDPADAIIAATAIEHDMPLCTANYKHFKTIAGLRLKAFRP